MWVGWRGARWWQLCSGGLKPPPQKKQSQRDGDSFPSFLARLQLQHGHARDCLAFGFSPSTRTASHTILRHLVCNVCHKNEPINGPKPLSCEWGVGFKAFPTILRQCLFCKLRVACREKVGYMFSTRLHLTYN